MDLKELKLGDRIAGVCGILLLIGLLFFPWHNIEFLGFTETRSAIQSPNAFWGWLAFLTTAAVIAIVIIDRLTTAELPDLPIGYHQATFFLTLATGALLLLKLVVETDFLGWGAWINLLLCAGMIYGGFLVMQGGAEPDTGGGPPQQF